MSDIVERLMRFDGRVCVSSDLEIEAADLIERQREALRVAREALVIGGVSDKFIEDAIAAIDAALKEQNDA